MGRTRPGSPQITWAYSFTMNLNTCKQETQKQRDTKHEDLAGFPTTHMSIVPLQRASTQTKGRKTSEENNIGIFMCIGAQIIKRAQQTNREGKAKARKVVNKTRRGSHHHIIMFFLEKTKGEKAKAKGV